MRLINLVGLLALVGACAGDVTPTDTSEPTDETGTDSGTVTVTESVAYEVWGSDQSNSVSGVASRGISGSFLWIWDSADIEAQLAGGANAAPLPCGPSDGGAGPCDLHDLFPQGLTEVDADGTPTGNTLGDLDGFGRLHGVIVDPQQRYVTANIFAPGGAYVGVVDTQTKEAIGLFRATGTNVAGPARAPCTCRSGAPTVARS